MSLYSFIIPLFLLLLTSCQPDDNNLKKGTIILDWYPSPNHVPLFAGQEKGIFRKHGIDLNIKKPHDFPEIPTLVSSGQVDFGLYTMPHTILSATRGKQVKVIATIIGTPMNGIYHLRNKTSCDFSDHKNGCFSSSYHFLSRYAGKALESHYGINFSERLKVRFDPITCLATDRATVVSGALVNIEKVCWEEEGLDLCYHPFDTIGIPSYSEIVVIGNDRDPALNVAFKKAITESIDYCLQNSDEAFNAYAKLQPNKSHKTLAWEKKGWNRTINLLNNEQKLDRNQWEKFYSWMQTENFINQEIDIDTLLSEDT